MVEGVYNASNNSGNKWPHKLINRTTLCGICKKTLADPKQLGSCLHSFCSSCVADLPRKQEGEEEGITCPSCETFTKTEGIETPSFVHQLLDLKRKRVEPVAEWETKPSLPCQQCKEHAIEANWRCLDCKNNICDKCKAMHENIPVLNQHDFQALSESNEEYLPIDAVLFCAEHVKKQLELNCLTCGEQICYICKTDDKHSGHTTESTDAALERINIEVTAAKDQIELHFSARQKQIEIIRHKIGETRESYAAKRKDLDDKINIVINRLKTFKLKLEEELNEQEITVLTELEKWNKQLDAKQSREQVVLDLAQACHTYTRHLSQLQAVQGKMHGKVMEQSKHPVEKVSIKLPDCSIKSVYEISENLHEMLKVIDVSERNVEIDVEGTLEIYSDM